MVKQLNWLEKKNRTSNRRMAIAAGRLRRVVYFVKYSTGGRYRRNGVVTMPKGTVSHYRYTWKKVF